MGGAGRGTVWCSLVTRPFPLPYFIACSRQILVGSGNGLGTRLATGRAWQYRGNGWDRMVTMGGAGQATVALDRLPCGDNGWNRTGYCLTGLLQLLLSSNQLWLQLLALSRSQLALQFQLIPHNYNYDYNYTLYICNMQSIIGGAKPCMFRWIFITSYSNFCNQYVFYVGEHTYRYWPPSYWVVELQPQGNQLQLQLLRQNYHQLQLKLRLHRNL